MRYRSKPHFQNHTEGVSPVVAIIITVAIVVVIAAIAYIWFSNLASDTGDTPVKPLSIIPELNLDRTEEELALEIVVGDNINWDNYDVMLNEVEVNTAPGTISNAGDTVYFDYKGERLSAGTIYPLEIIDLEAQIIVYSDTVIARSYIPQSTGVSGIVTSGDSGLPLMNADVYLYQNNQRINYSTTGPDGAYRIECEEGTYDLRCIINQSLSGKITTAFKNYSAELTVIKYEMLEHNIQLELILPETATLKGYVYDENTQSPIAGAEIMLSDNEFYAKSGQTDGNGYYEFSLAALNLSLQCSYKGYSDYKKDIQMVESETETLDIYLTPIPPQTGTVYGYLYDVKSNEPLSGKKVFSKSEYLTNSTKTNETGYFEINVVPGVVTVFVNTADYDYWEKIITVQESENYLLYIYLEKEKGG